MDVKRVGWPDGAYHRGSARPRTELTSVRAGPLRSHRTVQLPFNRRDKSRHVIWQLLPYERTIKARTYNRGKSGAPILYVCHGSAMQKVQRDLTELLNMERACEY